MHYTSALFLCFFLVVSNPDGRSVVHAQSLPKLPHLSRIFRQADLEKRPVNMDSILRAIHQVRRLLHNAAPSVRKDSLQLASLAMLCELYCLTRNPHQHPDSAARYAQLMVELARKTHQPEKEAEAYVFWGEAMDDKQDYAKAFEYHQKSLDICQKLNNDRTITLQSELLSSIANYHGMMSDTAQAINHQISALRLLETHYQASKNADLLPNIYNRYELLARLYNDFGMPRLALQYFRKIRPVYEQQQLAFGLANIGQHEANSWLQIHQPRKAIQLLQNAAVYYEKTGNSTKMRRCWAWLGKSHFDLKQYAIAIDYSKQAIGNDPTQCNCQKMAYQVLYLAYQHLGMPDSSQRYAGLYATLQAESQSAQRQIQFLLIKSQFRKEQEINRLQAENLNHDKRLINVLMFAVLLLSVAGGSLGWYYRKVKQQNSKLEHKQKEIEEAMFKGQSIERKRVAADLHDNLGSLLAASRMSLQSIDPQKLSSKEQTVYAHILDMLREVGHQIRTLSHSMLPASLENKGLTAALEELVEQLNLGKQTHFTLHTHDFDRNPDKRIELELYSICLELSHNILKHSKATHAHIQLETNAQWVLLNISDNGVGFEAMQLTHGKGLSNLTERAEGIGGRFHFTSSPKKGVQIHLTVPLKFTAETVHDAAKIA